MASGLQTYISSATINGVTHTNKWMDLDDVFDPRGNATKISNVGIQDTAGSDISNRFLPLAGGAKLGESTGLKNTGNVDLTDLFATKGSGLANWSFSPASLYHVVPTTTGGAGTARSGTLVAAGLPKAPSNYTFAWSLSGTSGTVAIVWDDNAGSATISCNLTSLNVQPQGTVNLTITDNATGQTSTKSTSYTFGTYTG